MKKQSICIIFILAVLGLLLSPGHSTGVRAAPATIHFVSPDGICAGNTPCTSTVQAAVEAASTGHEIRVAEGEYMDMHDCLRNDVVTTGVAPAVVCLNKTLTILGGYNSTFTSRDPETYLSYLKAEGAGRVLYITGEISPTVDGLVINGGNAAGLGGNNYAGTMDVGGGVYIMTANAVLVSNLIGKNTAPGGGGGVYIGASSSQLINNTIDSNTTTDSSTAAGAGVMLYEGSPSLTGNQIMMNISAYNAGGVYMLFSDATLNSNSITGNQAYEFGAGVDAASCNPTLRGNYIHGNTSQKGAGVALWYSHSLLVNNVITDNLATSGGEGSGLWIGGSMPTLQHTTIAGNSGGDGSAVFISKAGASPSTVSMTNSILAGQATAVHVTAGSQADLDGVLWFNNSANTGGAGSVNVTHAYTGDPAFEVDGYHLQPSSAAINRGVTTGLPIDVDNQLRDYRPDLGADEYLAPGMQYLFLPLAIR